jgi:hypothetical protein
MDHIENTPIYIAVVQLLHLYSNGLHNTISNSNSTVVGMCLPRCCTAMAVVSLFVSRSLPSIWYIWNIIIILSTQKIMDHDQFYIYWDFFTLKTKKIHKQNEIILWENDADQKRFHIISQYLFHILWPYRKFGCGWYSCEIQGKDCFLAVHPKKWKRYGTTLCKLCASKGHRPTNGMTLYQHIFFLIFTPSNLHTRKITSSGTVHHKRNSMHMNFVPKILKLK